MGEAVDGYVQVELTIDAAYHMDALDAYSSKVRHRLQRRDPKIRMFGFFRTKSAPKGTT
jgi:hypothetical protein